MEKERARRKKKGRVQQTDKDNTASVYREIIAEMGDSYYKGYSTSEDDTDQEDYENMVDVEENDSPVKMRPGGTS